jgi:sugar lactone lactonase YvrE
MRNPHADGPPPQYGWVVTTIAGDGTVGSVDGLGTAAQFYLPQEITLDAGGNLFVTDADNHRIRKIANDGFWTVTTIAGGTAGYADSPGPQFHAPSGITLDAGENLYVGDSDNHNIRKIANDGLWTVTTFAGSTSTTPASGNTDDTGNAARFTNPRGITVDGMGNLYVANSGNHNIRKITSGSVVTTIAGSISTPSESGNTDAVGTAARFHGPSGITIDSAGNLYVAESGGHRIRKIVEALGTFTVSTIAGGGILGDYADGIGTDARFNTPFGITVDGAGNLYVADRSNHRIRKIANDGSWTVTTIAGDGSPGYADGIGIAARFNGPHGITLDGAGNLYVGDREGHRIRKLSWQQIN